MFGHIELYKRQTGPFAHIGSLGFMFLQPQRPMLLRRLRQMLKLKRSVSQSKHHIISEDESFFLWANIFV